MEDKISKITSLCKRRGFIFPSSEIYGGLQNSWDYGPLGVELKNNIKQEWWKRFVQQRSDIIGIDTALLMNPKVWESSGHLKNFSDPLVECKKCHNRFREDLLKEKECPDCKGELTKPQQFNLMLKTFLGATEDKASQVYFRPETAQGMFVNFKNILDSMRKQLPFGIAQIGKAFRNEITPGNFIFRMREFEQMEIEYFIPKPNNDKEWQKYFEQWRKDMLDWIEYLGINLKHIHELEVPENERAHYSKKTIDFEYDFPFGLKELYGLAYRTDFDLKNHDEKSGQNLKYKDGEGKEYWPHVIEPTWGVDRSVLAAMSEAYTEEDAPTAEEGETDKRVVMKFPYWLAPIKVAVLPLSKKDNLSKMAKDIFKDVLSNFPAEYDETQSIGKRYRRMDEVGVVVSITCDFQTLDDNTVTLRDRDSMKQIRVGIPKLVEVIQKIFKGAEFLKLGEIVK